MKAWFQLTANTGPDECCLAVAKIMPQFIRHAAQLGLRINVLELVEGTRAGTLRSALLEVDDLSPEQATTQHSIMDLQHQWCGSILWVCQSPYRPKHGRKNWFIGVQAYAPPQAIAESAVRIETCRAGGPGGQHVNTTDSAVRVTHIGTGVSVRIQTERSQLANKKLALQVLANKLHELEVTQAAQNKGNRRMHHHSVERGNAVKVFEGLRFVQRS